MNGINIINAIIKTTDCLKDLSEVTKENMGQVGKLIIQDQDRRNAFLNKLTNRICLQEVISNPAFKNPLEHFKSGSVPFGEYKQSLYTNPAQEESYDMKSTDLLKIKNPDVKAVYFGTLRQSKYPVSVNLVMLQQAFVGDKGFNQLVSSISSSLISGDNIDEFNLMKNLLVNAYKNSRVIIIEIDGVTEKEKLENLVIAINTFSGNLTMATTQYSPYNLVYKAEIEAGTETPCKIWTPKEFQSLIMTNEVNSTMGIRTFSGMFNKEYAKIEPKKFFVDGFGDTDAVAFLIDDRFFSVEDIFESTGNFTNEDNLTFKTIRHHHQRYGYNIIPNAIAFRFKKPQQTTNGQA